MKGLALFWAGSILMMGADAVFAEEENRVRLLRTFSETPDTSSSARLPRFETVLAEESGVDFSIPIDDEHQDRRLYYSSMACGSAASGDLDGDGFPELFFAAGPVANRLYRNVGEGKALRFEPVELVPEMADEESWSTGSAMVDIDNDGDLDLYVCRYDAPNRLWLNDSEPGKFRFRESAALFGLDLVDASLMPSFADYDRDGDLDVFVVMNAYYRKGGRPPEGVPMRKTRTGWEVVPPMDRFFRFSSIDPATGEPSYDECGRPNRLLRNDGGLFVDVSEAVGLRPDKAHTNGSVWWDFDSDGYLDLYVANDFAATDRCYRNQGDGTFREMAADLFQHSTWFSMGAAAEDFNGDGRTDLVVADMAPTTHYRQKVTMGEMSASFDAMYAAGLPRQNMVNTYFVNTGAGLFFEAARQAGIAQTDWTWTVKSGDLDNDGRVDLYFTTGHSRDFNNSDLKQVSPAERVGREDWDFFRDVPELRERDLAFQNALNWGFQNANAAWGFGQRETMSYGASLADLDRDGDLDLVTMRLNDALGLYRNRSADEFGTRSVLLSLQGRKSNRFGLGARLRLETADGKTQTRTLLTQNGYQESDAPQVHFGVGGADAIAKLTIEWPSGIIQVLRDLPTNRWWEITEKDASEKEAHDRDPETAPLFRRSRTLSQLRLREQPFDDFYRQPLLPHQHSQLGPGMAWGDADGDGNFDLYLGGPKGQSGYLLMGRGVDAEGEPVFALRMRKPFTETKSNEDLGALWFEADGDGDADLLVVSGSVECEPGDADLVDRLYLNDGTGNFSDGTGRLPTEEKGGPASGSVAAAADFDRDGDLDVFIGGRVVPGEYPLPARNQLLRNDGGTFVEIADEFGLEKTGLVTAALWSDVDADGWIDLLVAHEWGAIRLFRNREGELVDETASTGLADATGFWNSIAGRDLDGDGDIDFLAGNLGHNTKYHASPELPEIIYYGAFDESGRKNLIEAKIDKKQNCLLPRRGLSCSSRAMPSLLGKVRTYHGWASSTLGDLYADQNLAKASRWEATTLDSVLLLNDGEGRFEIRPLPEMAQLAPLFGIALTDVDADGVTDAVLAQNFLTPQQETGPYDGSLSLLLRGERTDGGDFRFSESWPLESGIAIPGDAKSLTVADLDFDARPDLFFGVNNHAPILFLNESITGDPLAIELVGDSGNPHAVGAKVVVEIEGRITQATEIQAGAGYLSQSIPRQFFGWGNSAEEKALPDRADVTIFWPRGRKSMHSLARADGPNYKIHLK